MRRLLMSSCLAAFGIVSAAHAEPACFTRTDLAWSPTVTRHFTWIDAAGKGCVTTDQIARFVAAMKADRIAQKERVSLATESTSR